MSTLESTALELWSRRFCETPLPVLRRTALRLEAIAADDERVDARRLAAVVRDDPLMTLKTLAWVAQARPARCEADAETVTASILMTGVPRFLAQFRGQRTVRDVLHAHPQAAGGLVRVLKRSHRAARFALAIAVQRRDTDAEVIHEAALLHDFPESLLWCHAPAIALKMQARQRADAQLRSAAVQRELLGFELVDLKQRLMVRWRLPELLLQLEDHRHAEQPRVRNVMLAVALARHTQDGWGNAAVPDDLAAIGLLLNQSTPSVLRRMREVDGRS